MSSRGLTFANIGTFRVEEKSVLLIRRGIASFLGELGFRPYCQENGCKCKDCLYIKMTGLSDMATFLIQNTGKEGAISAECHVDDEGKIKAVLTATAFSYPNPDDLDVDYDDIFFLILATVRGYAVRPIHFVGMKSNKATVVLPLYMAVA